MNVFAVSDDAQVGAIHLDMNYRFSHFWDIESQNELGRFNFRTAPDDSYAFFWLGVTHRPLPARNDSITLFLTNKVLNDSYAKPPAARSFKNEPLFRRFTYAGLQAEFRF